MGNYIVSLFLICALSACGFFKNHKEKEASTPTSAEKLRDLFEEKKLVYASLADAATLWPALDDCDGLLWAGLVCAAGIRADVGLAEYEPGVIHRRPYRACWTRADGDLGSKSTVSNDMLLGYLWCGWRSKDLAAMQRLGSYGEKHNFIMGEPFPEQAARVVLKPNGQSLLGRIIYDLSDHTDQRSYRDIPLVYLPVAEDFERHLQVLGILLGGELSQLGGETGIVDINGESLARLEENVAGYPGDALFQAALGVYTGDFSAAMSLLEDENYVYPSYVRGAENYKLAHWLFTANLVLERYHGE
jgi:hypothetical protein